MIYALNTDQPYYHNTHFDEAFTRTLVLGAFIAASMWGKKLMATSIPEISHSSHNIWECQRSIIESLIDGADVLESAKVGSSSAPAYTPDILDSPPDYTPPVSDSRKNPLAATQRKD